MVMDYQLSVFSNFVNLIPKSEQAMKLIKNALLSGTVAGRQFLQEFEGGISGSLFAVFTEV
jgi:uncharacterized membrane protein